MTLTRAFTDARARRLGTAVLVGVVLFGVLVFHRDRLTTTLSPGDTVYVEFAQQYHLEPYSSQVKLAGVRVGVVTQVSRTTGGGEKATLKLDRGVRADLGGQPTAAIRPTTVLGGVYYVDLTPGGRGEPFAGSIPTAQTQVPVEVGQVLSAIGPPAQQGMRGAVRKLNDTLRPDGATAIRDFLRETPQALRPAAEVTQALRGTEPEHDIADLVTGLEGAAAALTHQDGQLDSTITALHTTSAALAAESRPVAIATGQLPATLTITGEGMADLGGALDRLNSTAPGLRSSVRQLSPLFESLTPVVHRGAPMMRQLRGVLEDTRPALHELVPATASAAAIVGDLRGPVTDRLDGPIKDMVMGPWRGTGPTYQGGGNDHLFYQELAYLCALGDQDFMFFRPGGGAMSRLMAGIGLNTPTGGSRFPPTVERQLEGFGLNRPPGPQDAHPSPLLLPLMGGNK
jgi:phospholipid/cholesterol/gamma-HCH transport system substrate-binding protein